MRDIALRNDELYTVKLHSKENLSDHCCHLQEEFMTKDSSADRKVMNSIIKLELSPSFDASKETTKFAIYRRNL